MVRLLLICFGFVLCLQAEAQDRFICFEGTTTMPEGGTIENYNVIYGDFRFTFVPPNDFSVYSEASTRKVWLKVANKAAISIELTSGHRGTLPDVETLKNAVLRRYTGAAILNSDVCYSGMGRGHMIDVKRVLDGNSSLTTRHVFLPSAGGTMEIIFSTNSEDFEQYRNSFGNLLNSFHVEPYTERNP